MKNKRQLGVDRLPLRCNGRRGEAFFPERTIGAGLSAVPGLSGDKTEPHSLNDWVALIRQVWSCGAVRSLELSRLVSRVRRSLPRGSWSQLWRTGQLPFSKRKGEMPVVIGLELGGNECAELCQLPAPWNTLYHLARLGRAEVGRLMAQWRVHAGLTLREAQTPLFELHPEWSRTTARSKLRFKPRLARLASWLLAKADNLSQEEREHVREQLLNLAEELEFSADAGFLRTVASLANHSPTLPDRASVLAL